tara:strand:+ start:2209 stop:2451 length:243 start_codon:yes stop_codon:yes gene_type:complete
LEGWSSTTELHPRKEGIYLISPYIQEVFCGGGGRIRTFEDRSQRVYSPPHLTALVPLQLKLLLYKNKHLKQSKKVIKFDK